MSKTFFQCSIMALVVSAKNFLKRKCGHCPLATLFNSTVNGGGAKVSIGRWSSQTSWLASVAFGQKKACVGTFNRYNQTHMNNTYPCYRVSSHSSGFTYFPKSREGFEQAIEFAKEQNCYYVYCVSTPSGESSFDESFVEVAWEGYPKSFGGAMMKAAQKTQL